MIENMLGMDQLPLPVKLIVAFVIVLVLIALVLWVIRRLSGGRLGTTPTRGRQPRLAVIDAAAVDSRRRLVLIRRDNVEHLIMIGGPTDVVVEQNIVRAVPVSAPRETQVPRGTGELAPRPIPEPSVRVPVEPPRNAPAAERSSARMPPPAPRPPRLEPSRPPAVERAMPPSLQPEPEPAMVETQAAAPNADANLADMAQKLEAALRRPPPTKRPEANSTETPATLFEATPSTAPEQDANNAARAFGPAVPADSAAAAPSNAPRSVFDSLEEEMASLLAKPNAKP